MQDTYDSKYLDWHYQFNEDQFLKLLGVLIRMGIYNIPIRDFFQVESEHPDFGVKDHFSRAKLIRFMQCLKFPGAEGESDTSSDTNTSKEASTDHESEEDSNSKGIDDLESGEEQPEAE